MLSVKEFNRLLSDRSISWKLRATIDYSEYGINKDFLKVVERQALDSADGKTRRLGKGKASDEKAITEDDYFQHLNNPASFLQSKSPV